MDPPNSPDDILHFWFDEIDSAQWWKADPAFDQLIVERFSGIHAQVNCCKSFSWRKNPQGRLAEIIVLDQFSRNMFRGTAQAFASDPLALALAQEAINTGADQALTPAQRNFLYMPFMHSESRLIHAFAEPLFREHATKNTYEFEMRHKVIIDRFGRYPHRNVILGRESTAQELEFLKQPGSSF
ncbi:MAG TPA: DUF924 family protein [Dokdonella sp.]|uniref:DUF924 family protein n=1 Tax=Dokdonella sp. TaxID=2291710 RepID=UPI002D801264|nr:DUF924 family protein [Dokdonella sp.]HET9034128.1 DUF924 family protein [Dokdonella sp.]